MKNVLMMTLSLVLISAAWGQAPSRGPDFGALGLSEAEAKAVETDLKAWEQSNREWEADLQLIDAQRNRLMVRDALDKGALEKTFRDQYEIFLKRDLARLDLMVKWRAAFGAEKARGLDGIFRGPQGPQGPNQPGQPGQPGQPKKP